MSRCAQNRIVGAPSGAGIARVQVAGVRARLGRALVLGQLEPDLGRDVVRGRPLAARGAGYLAEPDEVRTQPVALGLGRAQLLRADPGQRLGVVSLLRLLDL